jgi:hypothetical protein
LQEETDKAFHRILGVRLHLSWKRRNIIGVPQARLMGGEENGSLRAKEKALSGHEGHIRPSTSAATDYYYLITELNVCQLFSSFFLIFPNVRKTMTELPPREDLKKKLHSAI